MMIFIVVSIIYVTIVIIIFVVTYQVLEAHLITCTHQNEPDAV